MKLFSLFLFTLTFLVAHPLLEKHPEAKVIKIKLRVSNGTPIDIESILILDKELKKLAFSQTSSAVGIIYNEDNKSFLYLQNNEFKPVENCSTCNFIGGNENVLHQSDTITRIKEVL